MAFSFHRDGRCNECKRQTDFKCDCCENYICEEHAYKKGKGIFCKKCFKKGEKPLKYKKGLNLFKGYP